MGWLFFGNLEERAILGTQVTLVILNKSFEVLENSKKVMKSFAHAFSMGLHYIAERPFSGFIRASEFLHLLELIVHLWKAWFSNHQTFISRAFFSDSTDEFQPQLKITNFNLSPCFTSIIILNSELNWRKLIVFFHVITFQFASIKAKASKRTSNSPRISD